MAVVGHVAVPGDKSISHRAVLIGSIAEGETRVTGFGRSGDTQATVDGMRALGGRIRSRKDGWTITGVPTRLKGGRVDARGDHRIAMLAAVAGLASREGVTIEGAGTAAISFPGFYDLLESVTRR